MRNPESRIQKGENKTRRLGLGDAWFIALVAVFFAGLTGCVFLAGIDSGTRTFGLNPEWKAIMPPQDVAVPAHASATDQAKRFLTLESATNTVTLAADFEPTGIGGLTAFLEVTQDFTSWTRFSQPYPMRGWSVTRRSRE